MKEPKFLTRQEALEICLQQQFIQAWKLFEWKAWFDELYGENESLCWDGVFSAVLDRNNNAELPIGSADSKVKGLFNGLSGEIKPFQKPFAEQRGKQWYLVAEITAVKPRKQIIKAAMAVE